MKSNEQAPVQRQRPFHICPECSAYNAKVNPTCWRCGHDMSKGAVEPKGVMGYRLEQIAGDSASKGKPDAD